MPFAPTSAALLLWLASVASTDAELAMLRSSLRASEVRSVEADLGGLASLPTVRIDARLLPRSERLEGVVQLSLPAAQAKSGLDLCVRADRAGAAQVRGEVVSLGVAKVRGVAVPLERRAPGSYRVPPIAASDDERIELEIPFGASLVGLVHGFFAAGHSRGFLGRFEDGYLLTGFHPEPCTGAATSAPVYGDAEPDWGALGNFVVSLVAPRDFLVVGSGTPLGEIPGPDGTVRFTRVGAALRGFALAAVRGHRQNRITGKGVSLTATFGPDDEEAAKAALEVARRALAALGKDLGPYPWSSLELVALPVRMPCFAFPGLLACGTEGLGGLSALGDHGLSIGFPQNLRAALEYEIAHATAHQWLGGLIASDNHAHPELDEPLATFLALLFARKHLSGEHCVDEESFLKVPFALYRLRSGDDAPAARPLSAYGSRLEVVALLHGKGGMLHRALRRTFGVSAWHKAVRRYAKEKRFEQVTSDGVLELLRASAPSRAAALDELRERHLHGLHAATDLAYDLKP